MHDARPGLKAARRLEPAAPIAGERERPAEGRFDGVQREPYATCMLEWARMRAARAMVAAILRLGETEPQRP